MDKVLLIDGHNAMWRASIGFGPGKRVMHAMCLDCDALNLLHRNGDDHCICGGLWFDGKCEEEPTEEFVTIFNFFRNLRPIIEKFSPDKCFFVLEGHPQFRYDLFADYKANRFIKTGAKSKEQLDKFYKSKDEIVRLLQYLPLTICRAHDYEADDVIFTLCKNLQDEELTILSNDSDYIQLLQLGLSSVQVYNPIKKEFMKAPVYPYVAWKCLNGDKADNIPPLLKPKKVLDTINDPDLFQKFMEVEENRANFSVNRQLIEFRDVPEEEIILKEGERDFDTLKEEFRRMKFESIINDKSWVKYYETFDCLKY